MSVKTCYLRGKIQEGIKILINRESNILKRRIKIVSLNHDGEIEETKSCPIKNCLRADL